MLNRISAVFIIFLFAFFQGSAQSSSGSHQAADSIPSYTLASCIQYAFINQPALQRSVIGEEIARKTNQIALSGWLPQINVNGTFTHYFQLPASTVSGVGASSTGNGTGNNGTVLSGQRTGASRNTATPVLAATQAIFSPDLLYAAKSAKYYLLRSRQASDSTRIFLVSAVSKSFYSLLLTLEQTKVLKDDTTRLGKNLNDTYHQYKSGLVDETDYDEADIALSNARIQLRQASENIAPLYAQLKQVMGYPVEKQFNVSFDTLQMKHGINLDTSLVLDFDKRIETQQLKTEAELQKQLVYRYRYGFLPTVSAFYNYTHAWQNNDFSNIFQTAYPSSFAGLTLSFPVFSGLGRVRNLERARLEARQISLEQTGLRSLIFTQYQTALAAYKSNLYSMQVLERNAIKAKRVYFIVGLQYKQGIIPYLNVITAESNLVGSEIGYINALFQVLSSKIDVQKAMGTITYQGNP